ncbi:hypothetical protein CI109_101673 [Kwoniella shandongensis]|uniref:Uncharacterized protein n=1 Tax=Kwoniella shandongensis TaxID=1734106 RepID=A0A5M6C6U5_9TREE|nr:uncharacterized protein CI109_001203 [Kwoniella shandongensis]KAA5530400.1 hypothetical protein CI109_001203 [Kwoniella shandongensis]
MPITHLPLDHLLTSTDPADFSARRHLSDVSVSIAKSKKVVIVSGAGISCSSGIPDFRSEDGLYSLVRAKHPNAFLSGRDLFSAGTFSNPQTTSIFYTFIAELFLSCAAAQPTRTHHFIRKLEQKGKLLRSYTQNVDGLERRIGIESGGRGKGLKKKETKNVELHGDLGRVRCVLCMKDYEATNEWIEMFREGDAPECPSCLERCESRISRSARATPVGILRPAIVLYDEPHPLSDDIGQLTTYDLSRQPDVLLIMGTSLKVHGLKRLVKEFAKSVHGGAKRGLVVFVNATPPSKEWEGVIDVHIQGETDKWVERVEEEWRRVKPSDWEVQTRLDGEMVQVVSSAKTVSKGKSKALADSNKANRLPTQLPTPRSTASPRSPVKHHAPSSPLSAIEVNTKFDNDALSSPVAAPPTPLSPSKRRFNVQDSPSKKSKAYDIEPPKTGLPGTPGRGNLFASPQKAPLATAIANEDREKQAEEEEWEIFGSPTKKAQPQVVTLAKGRAIGKSVKGKSDGKENVPDSLKGTVSKVKKVRAVAASSPKVRRTRTRTAMTTPAVASVKA